LGGGLLRLFKHPAHPLQLEHWRGWFQPQQGDEAVQELPLSETQISLLLDEVTANAETLGTLALALQEQMEYQRTSSALIDAVLAMSQRIGWTSECANKGGKFHPDASAWILPSNGAPWVNRPASWWTPANWDQVVMLLDQCIADAQTIERLTLLVAAKQDGDAQSAGLIDAIMMMAQRISWALNFACASPDKRGRADRVLLSHLFDANDWRSLEASDVRPHNAR
jgi:hypothetical protein